jgi:8-oxo-dGTP pyrophosphatase MutT (NUDIX family)
MNFALIIPKIKGTDRLVFQRRDSQAPTDANLLGLFGGSIETGELPLDGAEREFAEETSFRLKRRDFKLVAATTMPTLKGEAQVHLYAVYIYYLTFVV